MLSIKFIFICRVGTQEIQKQQTTFRGCVISRAWKWQTLKQIAKKLEDNTSSTSKVPNQSRGLIFPAIPLGKVQKQKLSKNS